MLRNSPDNCDVFVGALLNVVGILPILVLLTVQEVIVCAIPKMAETV